MISSKFYIVDKKKNHMVAGQSRYNKKKLIKTKKVMVCRD